VRDAQPACGGDTECTLSYGTEYPDFIQLRGDHPASDLLVTWVPRNNYDYQWYCEEDPYPGSSSDGPVCTIDLRHVEFGDPLGDGRVLRVRSRDETPSIEG
jgi:hypothetical protein